MQVSAKLRYARISPQKCRLVADAVRGKTVESALEILAFMPKKGAAIVKKVLESAVANAEHNHGADHRGHASRSKRPVGWPGNRKTPKNSSANASNCLRLFFRNFNSGMFSELG